jgi:hypothetical protein
MLKCVDPVAGNRGGFTGLRRLSAIREALLNELSGNDVRLRFINTRLILSINVNLYEIPPSQDEAEGTVKLTLETLNKMGFLKQEGRRDG